MNRMPLTNEEATCHFGDRCDICKPSESVMQEAHRLVNGDRGRDYDHPATDYGRAVAIFNAWTGRDLSISEGVKFAIAIKMSRQVASPSLRDHYVDAAGYWGCLAKVEGIDR